MRGNHRPTPEEKRSHILNLRITKAEHERISDFCELHELSMSDFLRLSALAAMRGDST